MSVSIVFRVNLSSLGKIIKFIPIISPITISFVEQGQQKNERFPGSINSQKQSKPILTPLHIWLLLYKKDDRIMVNRDVRLVLFSGINFTGSRIVFRRGGVAVSGSGSVPVGSGARQLPASQCGQCKENEISGGQRTGTRPRGVVTIRQQSDR